MRAADESLSAARFFNRTPHHYGNRQMFKRFLADESGATAIEYGLIAGLIFLAIVSAIHYYTESIGEMYGKINTAVTDATTR